MTPFVRYLWSYAVHRNGRQLFEGQTVLCAADISDARIGIGRFLDRVKPRLLDEETRVTVLARSAWDSATPGSGQATLG